MVEEANNGHATNETEKIIEKELARQQTEMFTQFNDILMWVTLNSEESSTWNHSDKISPFKVKMNMDIPNLEGNIDNESVNDWVQQLVFDYVADQHSEVEKLTISFLNISTSVHYWWDNLLTKTEKKKTPSTHG